jgi:hypothetical protein
MALKIQGTTIVDDSRLLQNVTVDSDVVISPALLSKATVLGSSLVSNGAEFISTDSSTDAILMPSGSTAQRPSATNGMFRYNTDENEFEGYANGAWGPISGGGTEGGGAILINTDTVTETYSMPSGTNGFSVGPITVADGISVTVASGNRWVVI